MSEVVYKISQVRVLGADACPSEDGFGSLKVKQSKGTQ